MDKKKKFIKWLYSELPSLISGGVISEENARKIKTHYGEISEVNTGKLALAILSVTGALLIGGGIILLLAHNWESMTREYRAVISFIPLIISQILACYVMLKKRESAAWTESVATAWTVSVIACMSLICQTYNLGGDFNFFWFICIGLSLPAVYLLNSITACILCMAGIIFGLGYSRWENENPFYFWGLATATAPYICYSYHKYKNSMRNIYLSFAVIGFLTITAGMVSGNGLGVWVISFSSLFASIYLASVIIDNEKIPGWVFKYAGMTGIIIVSVILSFKTQWHFHSYRSYELLPYKELKAYIEYAYTGALLLFSIVFLFRLFVMKKYESLLWGLSGLVGVTAYVIDMLSETPEIPALMFSIFLAALGVLMLVRGFKLKSIFRMNWGIIIIALLILMRFFDSNIDFIVKGLVFMLIGIIILVFNLFLAKRIKAN